MFFKWGLFSDFEVQGSAVTIQLLFSLVFALSLALLELIIFEIVDIMARTNRFFFWQWTLGIMCSLLVLVIPLHLCFNSISSARTERNIGLRVATSFVLWVVFLFGFWKLGDPHPHESSSYGTLCLTQIIGRIAVVGVTCIAALSGFGAVYTPYNFLAYFVTTPTPEDVEKHDQELLRTMQSMVRRKRQIALAERRHSLGRKTSVDGGWGSSLMSMWGSGDKAAENIDLLQSEVHALENLSTQLFLECHDLREEIQRSEKQASLIGKLKHLAGHFLSAFGVYKIIMSSVNIVFNRVGKKDPITKAFEIAVVWCGLNIDVEFWSQQASFLVVGVLIVASVRNILITLTKFFHFFASSGSTNIIVLFLTEIMGMYFTSLVIMMRMNMPERYRQIIIQVLGDLEFHFYHQWFERIFLLSVMACVMAIYVSRIKYNKTE